MVDVGTKPETHRSATASCIVQMQPGTLARIFAVDIAKGDVLQVARLAGIMGAKRTADLIPLCHPLPINSVTVDCEAISATELRLMATVRVFGRTGVEMEALTAVSTAALTVYDMVKAIDRGVVITQVQLDEKSGGRSGHYHRSQKKLGDHAGNSGTES
jgi:cyclic pyranopterin phosphate synthase